MKYGYSGYQSNIVSISSLGSYGRWGNCLSQYSAAKKYAEMHNCRLQTPEWVGEKVFEINSERISTVLPTVEHDLLPWGRQNINLHGYFQNQDIVSKMSRKELKSWFRIQERWKKRFPKKKPFYVACHLRRGDYCSVFSDVFCTVSENSYFNCLQSLGIQKEDVVFVGDSIPETANDLKGMGIKHSAPAGDWGYDLEFLPDFMTLVNADIILRANSTFSWWAATLSNAKVYSPLVENKTGFQDVNFIEGNWPKIADPKNCGTHITDLYLPE